TATEPPPPAPITNVSISNICNIEAEPATREIAQVENPIKLKDNSFTAEWFIPPSALNMPHEVLITPNGEILVQANGSNQLYKVTSEGSITLFVEDVSGLYGDVDDSGIIYLYEFSTGAIVQIEPSGKVHTLVESTEISTACDSGFSLGEAGEFYIALNRCEDQSNLYQVTPQGEIQLVKENIPNLPALRMNAKGNLTGVSPIGDIYEISLPDFQFSWINQVDFPAGGMEYVSAGGLAFDDEDNLYISTCGRCNAGRIYKMDAQGSITIWADVPGNGLSGIEWFPKTGEIIGSQLRIGALVAVSGEGKTREIIQGSGIVTPTAIEFSPCGELIIGNDEGGNLSLCDTYGNVNWLADFISFGPPNANIAFEEDGTLYVSEAAPGFPDRILTMPVGESITKYADAIKPAGLIMLPDGDLMVAEPTESQISRIDATTKGKTILYDNLDFPTAIEQDGAGNLYVITASPELLWDEFWAVPVLGDQILRINPNGEVTSLYEGFGLRSLALGPDQNMYAAISDRVIRISSTGVVNEIAHGFRDAVDLVFDLEGDLYVCDRALNGVVRIAGFPGGSISGRVVDASNNPVKNARIWIYSTEPKLIGKTIFSDEKGEFMIKAAAREYVIVTSAKDFKTAINASIFVQNGQNTEVFIPLTPQ
ncbi:MAG: carboxypeptidase regulatory-like domain-containing protein, partial [Chloroflexota bacterium]